MKLSRAVAAAAATAVVTPLALLSASVAFADPADPAAVSDTTTVTATATSAGTGTPTGTATPADAGTSSATVTPTGTATATATSSPSATESSSRQPEPAADPSESSESSGPPASPAPSEPDVPFCEDVDAGHDAKISADIKGLPGRIVAGDGPHAFRLVVTNDSDAPIEDVHLYAEVENYELEESAFLSPYAELEFKDGDGWTRIGDGDWAGDAFLDTTLAAHASRSVELRLSIDAGARAGDAYSFGSGAYLDRVGDEDCIAEGWAQYDFEVLRAGSANPDPGTATPSDSDDKAQGGAGAPAAGDGNLAHTGSSSALPVIALVGGVTVVAGAGAVLAVRRRKGGTGT
ncbi:LAETG motif-containing sortase-dependent surface protein [Streptomyces sp. NPDC058739]|uniref:LAETG motif-containing sortase-dependent surface protein n=1 Tax=Streptomyces sp. NPDC058739 TaxID=3346618 RepID=UPI0036889339